jgi:hypothetical protein
MLSPQDSLSTQNVSAKCTSQVWKDLQRDVIVVNGDTVSGESGAEAMVGALVRHIFEKAEEIKALQDKFDHNNNNMGSRVMNNRPFAENNDHNNSNINSNGSNGLHPVSSSQSFSAALQATRTKLFSPQTAATTATPRVAVATSNGGVHGGFSIPYSSNNNSNNYNSINGMNNNDDVHDQRTPFHMPFSVSEAQIVQCARDLLVLCNRTQSGGDTYFCVDALLNGDKQHGLAILTPYSPQAEPLHFSVDIVQIQQFQNHSAGSFSPDRARPAAATTSSTTQISESSVVAGRPIAVTPLPPSPMPLPLSLTLSRSQSMEVTHNHTRSSNGTGHHKHDAHQDSGLVVASSTSQQELSHLGLDLSSPMSTPPLPLTLQLHDNNLLHLEEMIHDSNMPSTPLHVPTDSIQLQVQHNNTNSTNSTHLANEPFSPPGRRPQLDLISELEKDGFMLGVALRNNKTHNNSNNQQWSNPPLPPTASHTTYGGPSLLSLEDEEDEEEEEGAGEQREILTDPLFSQSTAYRSPHVLNNNHMNSSNSNGNNNTIHSHQHHQHQVAVDDCSVVSELTWDTHATNSRLPPPPRPLLPPSAYSTANANAMSSGLNLLPITTAISVQLQQQQQQQQSGLDDDREEYDQDENGGSTTSKKPKSKSLLRKLGKKLHKPFKMVENFDGFTSPFKHQRRETSLTQLSGNDELPQPQPQPHGTRSRHGSEAPPLSIAMLHSNTGPTPVKVEPLQLEALPPTLPLPQTLTPTCCVRIQVTAHSRYRLCTSNPTGVMELDSWSTLSGVFSQSFYIVGDGSGLLGIADRLVSISIDDASPAPPSPHPPPSSLVEESTA